VLPRAPTRLWWFWSIRTRISSKRTEAGVGASRFVGCLPRPPNSALAVSARQAATHSAGRGTPCRARNLVAAPAPRRASRRTHTSTGRSNARRSRMNWRRRTAGSALHPAELRARSSTNLAWARALVHGDFHSRPEIITGRSRAWRRRQFSVRWASAPGSSWPRARFRCSRCHS
jgi:hypothetical protein